MKSIDLSLESNLMTSSDPTAHDVEGQNLQLSNHRSTSRSIWGEAND